MVRLRTASTVVLQSKYFSALTIRFIISMEVDENPTTDALHTRDESTGSSGCGDGPPVTGEGTVDVSICSVDSCGSTVQFMTTYASALLQP